MDLTVLAVPDCPNVMLLERRLAQVIGGRRDVTIKRQVIADEDEAARRGMHGSPTILVDGIDPFADQGEPASVSCRLYWDGNGQVDGAPSINQLRQAIGQAVATKTDAGTPSWLDALGRGRRGRKAPAEGGLRAVHQAVLRSFATTARAPEQGLLDEAARPFDVRQVLAELAEGDFLHLDQAGQINAAYPFSATTPAPSLIPLCAIHLRRTVVAGGRRDRAAGPQGPAGGSPERGMTGTSSWRPAAGDLRCVYLAAGQGGCGHRFASGQPVSDCPAGPVTRARVVVASCWTAEGRGT